MGIAIGGQVRGWPGLMIGLICAITPAAAWEAMAVGDLAGLDIRFGKGVQHFYPSGRSLQQPRADDPFAEGPKWAYWRDEGGRFCALRPPSREWDCYDLDRDGSVVRFRGDDGGVVLGDILKGP